ncbi:MAG: hypothetical protein ABI600_13620 [Luteolibacter sp.]
MKSPNTNPQARSTHRVRRTWCASTISLLFISLLPISTAIAQPVENLKSAEASAAKPIAGKTEKPDAAKPKEPAPALNTPSRLISTESLDAYVASITATFSIQSRETDPFGLPQDPNAKPVIQNPIAKATHRAPQLQATPFADIIRLIVVNTIMPGEKRFLVGTRSISQGQQIPLTFRSKQIRVQVTEVTSQQITFRNLDTGETASRKLDILPVGMTPGSRGITAPGMVLDRPNAPIELETSEPPIETSQNR